MAHIPSGASAGLISGSNAKEFVDKADLTRASPNQRAVSPAETGNRSVTSQTVYLFLVDRLAMGGCVWV